jgi:exonuclease VII small subunit
MNALSEYLATLADQPLGTLVHIGAGNGRDLEGYDALAPDRLVLVEGDPDAAAELQRRVAHLPWAEVHARPVAAQAGPLAWNRYTLPGLNGPLQTGTLSAFYPRLRLFESRTLDAVALPELLAGLSLELEPGRVHVLVLDVPGQEGSLLASLPQQQIVKFGFVLLRGVREALLPWGCASTQAVGQLRAGCFDVMAGAVEQEPLWPVALLRFNAQRHQTEQLEQRLQSIQAALEASNKIAADRAAQIQQLTKELTEARQTVNLSVKMQALREADLRDLQGRYQTTLQEQQSQHELLTRLGQRLTTANQYFHQLALSKQVSVELAVAASTSSAQPGLTATTQQPGAAKP